MEAETRARVEEDASRERSTLTNARSAFERERGELLRRVAAAESAGQAAIAEVSVVPFADVVCVIVKAHHLSQSTSLKYAIDMG